MVTLTPNEAAAVSVISIIQVEMVDESSLNMTAKADGLKRTHVCIKSKCKNKVHGKEEDDGSVADKMESSLHRKYV